VELAQRLYTVRGWYTAKWHGGYFPGVHPASDIWSQAQNLGMEPHANGTGYIPVPGDMIIHAGTPGHVSIVDVVGAGFVQVREQNAASTGTAQYQLSGSTLSRSGYSTILGVVHNPADHLGGQSGNVSSPSVVNLADGPHIYFRGTDGLLKQTHWISTGWVTDTPTGTPMAGDPMAIVTSTDGPHIYFRGTDGLLKQTHWNSTGWVTDTPTGTPMAGDPMAIVTSTDGPHIYFRGTDGLLKQTHWINTGWVTDTPTGTPMAGDPMAIVTSTDGPHIYFRGTDGLLKQTHWISTGWVTDTPTGTPMT